MLHCLCCISELIFWMYCSFPSVRSRLNKEEMLVTVNLGEVKDYYASYLTVKLETSKFQTTCFTSCNMMKMDILDSSNTFRYVSLGHSALFRLI